MLAILVLFFFLNDCYVLLFSAQLVLWLFLFGSLEFPGEPITAAIYYFSTALHLSPVQAGCCFDEFCVNVQRNIPQCLQSGKNVTPKIKWRLIFSRSPVFHPVQTKQWISQNPPSSVMLSWISVSCVSLPCSLVSLNLSSTH